MLKCWQSSSILNTSRLCYTFTSVVPSLSAMSSSSSKENIVPDCSTSVVGPCGVSDWPDKTPLNQKKPVKARSTCQKTQKCQQTALSASQGTNTSEKPTDSFSAPRDMSQPSTKPRSTWSAATDKILVDLLIKKAEEGCKTSNGNFKAVVWNEAAVALKGSEQQTGGSQKTASSCESRWKKVCTV